MHWSTRCAVVIPSFNEGATIAALIDRARRHLPVVLVVNDGSTDDTVMQAQTAGAIVVHHDQNLGKGAALRTGLSRARQRGFDWALTLDGDGQHDPDDLPSFLRCAERTGACLIIGNRMGHAEAMPWLRRRVNRWMSRQISRYAGLDLPDTQCGFRLIHLEAWSTLPLATAHFEVESEILVAFLAAGHRIEFVPIVHRPSPRASRIAPVTDSLRWWRWWCSLPIRQRGARR